MWNKLVANKERIYASFLRAFGGSSILIQIGNMRDLRGLSGILWAAALAGCAAALRTVEAILSGTPDDGGTI